MTRKTPGSPNLEDLTLALERDVTEDDKAGNKEVSRSPQETVQEQVEHYLDSEGVFGRVEGVTPDREQFAEQQPVYMKFGSNAKAKEDLLAFANGKEGKEKEDALRAIRTVLSLDEKNAPLATKIEAKDVPPGQLEKFMEVVGEYGDLYRRAEQYVESLGKETLEKIARRSGRFSNYAHSLGTDTILKEWKKHIPSLAIREPKKFERLQAAVQMYQELEKGYKINSAKRAGKANINIDQYHYALGFKTSEARQKALAEVLSQQHPGIKGGWKMFLSGLTGGRIDAGRISREGRKELEAMVKATDEQIETIARFLGDIDENPYARVGFIEAFRK